MNHWFTFTKQIVNCVWLVNRRKNSGIVWPIESNQTTMQTHLFFYTLFMEFYGRWKTYYALLYLHQQNSVLNTTSIRVIDSQVRNIFIITLRCSLRYIILNTRCYDYNKSGTIRSLQSNLTNVFTENCRFGLIKYMSQIN